MEETAGEMEEGEQSQEAAVSPALIAVHPLEKSVVVAIGSELRVFDLEGDIPIPLSDNSGGPSHSEDIKAICFGANGNLFASAGNDKLVKVWVTDSWNCMRTVISEKRVSAAAISHDGLFVSFADKFGVVWILGLDEDNAKDSADKTPVPLLGHYCSIITSLEFSPNGQFIASADRDFKIRITVFPKRPLRGAHEIQSFCLGHTDFVSCLAFMSTPDSSQALLLSGSGDSTVRLWDFMSGCLLDTCEVVSKAGLLGPTDTEQSTAAVTDLCTTPDGSIVAAAIQSFHGVVLLGCNFHAKSLSVAKVISIGDCFVPTSLGMSSAGEHLWMVMGASNLPSPSSLSTLARVKVIAGFQKFMSDDGYHLTVLEDGEVPGGQKLLERLQGCLDVAEEDALVAAAEALKTAMRNLLVKRQYSLEKRELRKKSRNDRKFKQRQ